MLAVVLALASAVGYGASDYSAGLAARETSVIRITILAEGTSVVMLALVLPWVGLSAPSSPSLAWGAAGGIGGAVGALALYVGFRQAPFSVAGPLSAVAAAGFSVLAGLLFGERPSGLALTGIALALPAIVGVSLGPAGADHRPAAAPRHALGVIWGLVAGGGFAVLFIGLNRSGSGGGLWPVAAAQGAALVVVSCIGAATRDLHLPAAARWLAVLTGLAGGAGTILYFLATHVGRLATAAVLTSLYPAVTIVLARLLLGERLTAVRLAGLCLAAVSVGLIAVGGRQLERRGTGSRRFLQDCTDAP
jgi:drug/metabolite transporter (DMT)-like permease